MIGEFKLLEKTYVKNIFIISFLLLLFSSMSYALTTQDKGVFYWGNTTSNLYFNLWNTTDLNTTSVLNGTMANKVNWMYSAYSEVTDIGVVCTSDHSSRISLFVINTTTGIVDSSTTLESNAGSNLLPLCNVMYWNGTDDAIVVFEDESTGDDNFGIVAIDGLSIGTERTIAIEQPSGGSGRIGYFQIKESPTRQEAVIGWMNDIGADNSADFTTGFHIYGKGGNIISNHTSSYTQNVKTRPPIEWTSDGNYMIMVSNNQTAAGNANETMAVYNRTAGTVTEHYETFDDNVANRPLYHSATCQMNDRNDSIIYITQKYTGNRILVANVVHVNGTAESSMPTSDGNIEATANGDFLGCYAEPNTNDIHFFYIDSGADERGLKNFSYDSNTKTWSVSNIYDGTFSGNFSSNDLRGFHIAPSVNGNNVMVSVMDSYADMQSGIIWDTETWDNTSGYVVDTANTAVNQQFTFLFAGNLTTRGDTLPPEVLDLSTTVDDESITLSWISLENHNYSISLYNNSDYGANNLVETKSNATFSNNHTNEFTSLTASTDYWIQINTSDSSDNEKTYNTSFTTDAATYDLVVWAFEYDLPYNWSSPNNSIIRGGAMDLNLSIYNAGNADITDVTYNITVNGTEICNGIVNVTEDNTTNVTCSWTTVYGWIDGYLTLDTDNTISELDETNNNITIYIPFMDRPWFHFNLSDFYSDRDYCQNSSDNILTTTCNWIETYSTMDSWNEGWNGNNVGNRGKQGRYAAVGCAYCNYSNSTAVCNTVCTKARNHLFGWGNRTVTGYNDVQEIHELIHVGLIYDIMFPNLTEANKNLVSEQYEDICFQIFNLSNVRPDLDDDDNITGDNGKGFGSGMAGFCYTVIGASKTNPTLMYQLNTTYRTKNIPDEWMDREVSFLRSFKNDSEAQYQEGWHYTTYAYPHLSESLYFENRFGLVDQTLYGNALCAMAKTYIYMYLDYNYNGNTLRNDESRKFRALQRGDSNSYQAIDDGLFIDWGVTTLLASICADDNVKESIMYLRNLAYNSSDSTRDYTATYTYKGIIDDLGVTSFNSPVELMSRFTYDNANDIFYLRSNFTYRNDTIIQIDGGEERGAGHAQAQGYYIYALGEPFLDYEQTPYEDDVRMDTWKNGISLQNTTQAGEGQGGVWNTVEGEYGYHQYYGANEGTIKYSTQYPDYRTFSTTYGGDLEDYIGTNDSVYGGVYSKRPYYQNIVVHEYFVKFNDLLVKRTIVNNNNKSEVYHNFVNLLNESDYETNTVANLTFNRTRWDNQSVHLDINLLYSNTTFTIGGGATNISACYDKKSCTGSTQCNWSYRRTYLHSAVNDTDFIIAHHWYYAGDQVNQTLVGTTDLGVNQSNNIILYDLDGDNQVNFTNINSTGWALAYNEDDNQTGAFNTTFIKRNETTLFSSNDTVSVFIEENTQEIKVSLNTMQRDSFIDYAQSVNITIDANALTNNSNFTILKNGTESLSTTESATAVSFIASTHQNGDYYIITGNSTYAAAEEEETEEEEEDDITDYGGGGGFTPPKLLNPKSMDLIYDNQWVRNSKNKVIIQVYNNNDVLYVPPIVKLEYNASGIELIKKVSNNKEETEAIFEVKDSAELGNISLKVIVDDQTPLEKDMAIEILEKSDKISPRTVTQNMTFWLISGISALFIIIVITAFIFENTGKKTKI